MATTAINFSADSGTKPAEASQDNHFFKLFEGDAVRIAKACGLKAGAAYMAVAAHTKCWAAVSTIAQLSGHRSDRAASRQLRRLDDAGVIKIRPRRRKTSIYTVAHSDSSRQRYAQISRPWLAAHRDLGPSALFLLATLLAMAGSRRTFARKLDDLLAALGVPERTFYRLAGKIKERDWMSWRPLGGMIEFTMTENPDRAVALPKTTVLALPKTTEEVDKTSEVEKIFEVDKNKTGSRRTRLVQVQGLDRRAEAAQGRARGGGNSRAAAGAALQLRRHTRWFLVRALPKNHSIASACAPAADCEPIGGTSMVEGHQRSRPRDQQCTLV